MNKNQETVVEKVLITCEAMLLVLVLILLDFKKLLLGSAQTLQEGL